MEYPKDKLIEFKVTKSIMKYNHSLKQNVEIGTKQESKFFGLWYPHMMNEPKEKIWLEKMYQSGERIDTKSIDEFIQGDLFA